jgi:molybdopterin-guanine dinucleotide biosynthesis adapter protein
VRLIGLAGWSGSGKTTLLVKLIPALIARGRSVSTVKHAHHNFDIDKPGKDSYEHRAAGAREVLVSSARRWALMHELGGEPEATLRELVVHIAPVDFVIVEGFKSASHPKIEVHRSDIDKPLLYPNDSNIVAIASDSPPKDARIPTANLDDIEAIADLVERFAGPVPQ